MSTEFRKFWNYQSGKIQSMSEKSFSFPGKIDNNPVMLKYYTGKMENGTEKINSVTGKITIPPN